MRTVFVGAHENPNGINSYTYSMAIELCSRGYKSMVMSFGSCDKETYYKGIQIKQYKCLGSTTTSLPILYFRSIPYLIKHRHEIDVVMYQTVTYSVIPSFILNLFGIKTCSIIHSLAEDSPKHSCVKKKIIIASMRIAMTFTKNIFTVSRTKAMEVKNRYGRICNTILPCGVFIPEIKSSNTDYLEEKGIKKGKYFLSIGRIDPIKNIEVLIDAFKNHNYGDFQLVVGGDVGSAYGKTIVARAADCKNIIFPGIVYDEEKEQLLKNSIAFCLVSSSEGMPIALLEGMAYGNIPVVTEIPSIKEILYVDGIGLWNRVKNTKDLTDSMIQIETDYENLKEQENIVMQIISENYTWQRTCDKYLKAANNL